MTSEPVLLDELLATRDRMVGEIQQQLGDNEKRFLLSLVRTEPEWTLLGIAHLEQLPGIRWKLRNLEQLRKINARKFADQIDALVAGFAGIE
jgi:predicted transcriptional regulator